MELTDMSRYEEIVELRKDGLSYTRIGSRFNICRERVRQILKNNGNGTQNRTTIQQCSMLKVAEVARMLGIHINTVRRWGNDGIFTVYRIGSRGDRRFSREEVDLFIKKSKRSPIT
ncbi:helix-turn-helix domain-containing protein [Chloroflexota bacterium]